MNQCHIATDVDSALRDFPIGMEALYDRMASSVAVLPNVKHKALAIRIIQCTACALHALSIEELSQALGDDARGVLDLPRAIMDLCGGFVVADNDGNVVMVHQTARDYLLENDTAECSLRIDRHTAHKQLFLDALRCLASNSLRTGLARGQKLGFEQYAAEYWSAHLVQSRPGDEDCASTLRKFLTGRWSLTWIHVLAASGQLRCMIQSSKNLSRYAARRREQDTNAAILEHEFFENWAVDMIRIPGKFGQVLRRRPDLIYNFVPPFCPKSSPIYQQFGKRDGLIILGLSAEKWDDSVARIPTGSATSSLIQATSSVIAILNTTGRVLLHDASDFRQLPKSPLEHGEHVTKLQLNRTATLAATYGYRTTKVWDIKSGECMLSIASIESRPRPLVIQFSDDDSTLIMGTDDKRVRSVALGDDEPAWHMVAELDEEEIDGQYANSASNMALSRDGSMAVVGYRRYPVSAWELDGPIHIGHCHRTNEDTAIREVKELIWHPQQPEIFGLNFEGTVFRWAPYEDIAEEFSTGAAKMCLSKDGELLATGDSHGRIKLYATNGFALLYQLTSQFAVFGLTFSPDSRRIYDVRGSYANAWEPTALAKFKAMADTNTDPSSEYDASLSTGISIANLAAVDPITALSTSSGDHFVCSGTAKGVVNLHDVRTATVQTIYTSRAKFTVVQTVWSSDSKLLCFSDASKQITVMSILFTPDKVEWHAKQKAVIPTRQWLKKPISQMLFQDGSGLLLICTSSQLHVVSMETFEMLRTAEIDGTGAHFWIQHPRDKSLLLGLGVADLRVFDWDLTEHGKREFVSCAETPGKIDQMGEFLVSKAFPSQDNKHLLLHMVHPKRDSCPHFFFLDTSEIPIANNTVDDTPSTICLQPFDTHPSSQILNPLSLLPGDRLVFVSSVFSICSVRLSWKPSDVNIPSSSRAETPRQSRTQMLAPRGLEQRQRSPRGNRDEVQELFALPGDWISKDSLSICKVMPVERSFICPRNGEVAIVKCTALV